MPEYELYLIRIFLYMNRIVSVFSRIWADYPIYFNNKVIYFNNDDNIDNKEEENIEWYGLKSPSSPNQMKKLIPFENDLELTRYIKFRNIRNASQEELKEDIKLIKESNKQ